MSLDDLEGKSIFILREAYNKFKNPALLWSMGKDSTTLLWLCKKAFFGKIPFIVLHIDTGYKFREIYEFRDLYAKEWGLRLEVCKNAGADAAKITPEKGRFGCCSARKTEALNQAVAKFGVDGLIVGIRRDEHGIRNKERHFSPRNRYFGWNILSESCGGDSGIVSNQDAEFSGWNIFATDFGHETSHVRVHPLLDWTELDIWEYTQKEKIPIVELYLAKDGKRYRSIGCETCCSHISSDAGSVHAIVEELRVSKTKEREGRVQEKENEYNMQKLRSLGYM